MTLVYWYCRITWLAMIVGGLLNLVVLRYAFPVGLGIFIGGFVAWLVGFGIFAYQIHVQLPVVTSIDSDSVLYAILYPLIQKNRSDLDQLLTNVRLFAQQSHWFQMIAQLSEDGIVLVNMAGRIQSINPTAVSWFCPDCTPAGLNGELIEAAIRHPHVTDVLTLAKTSTEPVSSTLVNARLGSTMTIVVSAILDDNQCKIGYILIFRDITYRNQIDQLRKDVVDNISHELKTPVTAIAGFAETLLESPNLSADQIRRFITIISHHAGRLSQTIDGILTLSRVDRMATSLDRTAVTSDILFASAIENCSNELTQKPHPLSVIGPPILLLVHTGLIIQAITNLLINAIVHTDSNVPIQLTANSANNCAIITVKDFGTGIASEHLPHIFDRFYRANATRNCRGTGLGLAIVKEIASAHGGWVRVESVPGEGTEFHLLLPESDNRTNCDTSQLTYPLTHP